MNRCPIAAGLLAAVALLPGRALAIDFSYEGFADVRLIVPPTDGSYLYGDLGKLRFGYDNNSVYPAELVAEGRAQVTPELLATATARIDPNYGSTVDLIEGWARYRPVSTNSWRWSVKAGAFFPPMSLENDEVGWTSFWTITPSAINSWIGREFRVIGTEGTLEWRRAEGTLTLIGSIYGWNENAGILMAESGWNFDDRVTGLIERSRRPDATAIAFGVTPPLYVNLFKQIDNRPGWYLDLSYEPTDWGGIEIMRYDNNADPSKTSGNDISWHTTFWDFGLQKQIGKVTLLSQGMIGSTVIAPAPTFRIKTDYKSAYALVGWDLDNWWLAGRVDWFQTRTHEPGPPSLNSEDGHAGTFSVSYLPWKWLRLTAEYMVVDSNRPQRVVTGDPAHVVETQFQFAARAYF